MAENDDVKVVLIAGLRVMNGSNATVHTHGQTSSATSRCSNVDEDEEVLMSVLQKTLHIYD